MRLLNLIDSERQTEGIMEKKLHEAAMKGSVTSLLELLQEDPLLLDRIIAACIADTPLHIAVMLGHIDFAKQVLSRRPELASESDSKGSSPLHLASAKGYEELVKELLLIDSQICLSRDQNGRTPLQIATIKGRVTILSELIRVKPESTRVLTDRGETILHLCVKHNRLASLQLLVGSIQEDELLNWKDHDGNTILHLAVARKQIEAIQFLLTTTRVEVNVLNANGSTALDVLQQSSRDLRDTEIKESLRGAGALRARDMHFVSRDYVPTEVPQIAKPLVSQKSILKPQVNNPKHKHTDWLGRKRSALMVVASLIATVAFQAGLAPPGGVWQDELTQDAISSNSTEKPHHVGMSVMAYNQPIEYGQFMIFNTIAFLASLSIILLLVSGLPLKRRRWMWIQMVIMWIAITAQAVTYFISIRHMTPNQNEGVLYHVTQISVLLWLSLMGVVFIGNVIRMSFWFLRKYGYIKEREVVHTISMDDDQEEF